MKEKADSDRRYSVDEVRARFDNSITVEHLRDIKQVLFGICDVDVGVARDFPLIECVIGPYPHRREDNFEAVNWNLIYRSN